MNFKIIKCKTVGINGITKDKLYKIIENDEILNSDGIKYYMILDDYGVCGEFKATRFDIVFNYDNKVKTEESNTKIQNMDCTGCNQPALYCRKCIRKVMEYWEIEDFYKENTLSNSVKEMEDFIKQLSRETTLSQKDCSIIVRDIFLRDGNITDAQNLYHWFGLGGLMLYVSDSVKGLLGGNK